MYIIKACIVSILVVLRKLALLNAVSVPIFRLCTQFSFAKPPSSRTASFSSMETAPLNMAANTMAWVEARGSYSPASTTFQKAAYVSSRDARCAHVAIGWTDTKYCRRNRSAYSRQGRKVLSEGCSMTWLKNRPLVGAMYWAPGRRKSGMEMSEAPPSDMLSRPVGGPKAGDGPFGNDTPKGDRGVPP